MKDLSIFQITNLRVEAQYPLAKDYLGLGTYSNLRRYSVRTWNKFYQNQSAHRQKKMN